jgi:hypothetical protein
MGTVQCDETYVGPRKPRYAGTSKRGPWHQQDSFILFCAAERQGQIRRRVVSDVTGATLKAAIREEVDSRARIVR